MSQTPFGLPLKILAVVTPGDPSTAAHRGARELAQALDERDLAYVVAHSAEDAEAAIQQDPLIGCLVVDWDLAGELRDGHVPASRVLTFFRSRNADAPVFLVGERSLASDVPLDMLQAADDFIWRNGETATFIAGRIQAAMERYAADLLPPMFDALVHYGRLHAYAWCTPGHTGGTAFLKTPVSRLFFDYFGERLFRADLSISMGELGSLLDHSGPIGDGERNSARVFGAHRTYTVTNGSSTSNRVILTASLVEGDIALCDRNCHKSVEHGMTLTGAIPVYLVPHRNRYGIIGPVYPEAFTEEAVAASIESHPIARSAQVKKPRHTVITNSTYDGLTYNVRRVTEVAGAHLDRLHFDEAWYAYARFNPLYHERFAMHGDPATYVGPTLFATHSTHKLLAALSQASFIHVRDGRDPIEHGRFNEAFMMHASTSPQYAIIASNDVTTAMMDGPSGLVLTTDSIAEAITFRQTVGRLREKLRERGEWFFSTWNPDVVTDPATGGILPFDRAPLDLLTREPGCWILRPGAAWHGFDGIEDGYCMLDPIKVTLLTPGVAESGGLEERGIPATLVTAYLDAAGIIVEKTQDFSILFLFSIGVTKGKWGSLLTRLLDFRTDYDANRPLEHVMPDLVAATGTRYAGMGLRDLADEMFEQYRSSGQMESLNAAFGTLPEVVSTPREAYRHLVRGEVEHVALDGIGGRVAATGIVPYPPGIPMVMPGERVGPANGPYVSYLRALRDWDRRFPGFTHDTHGVEMEDGEYFIYCVAEGGAAKGGGAA